MTPVVLSPLEVVTAFLWAAAGVYGWLWLAYVLLRLWDRHERRRHRDT